MDTAIGWFADPIYLGKYPDSLKEMLGDRLPEFTEDEVALLKGSSEVCHVPFLFCRVGGLLLIRLLSSMGVM